jgi:hypothetical protein
MSVERLEHQKTRLRLRAAALVFALFVSGPLAASAQAADSGDVCAMACCIRDGYCCCSPRRAHVQGETTDGRAHISSARVSAECPEGCSKLQSGSYFPLRDSLRANNHHLEELQTASHSLRHIRVIPNSFEFACSTPRAPPSLLTNQTA